VVFEMDLPGAVGSRIQGAQDRDIQALIDEGICDPHTIDDIIEFGFGRRLAFTGFFKRQGLLGQDFIYTVTKGHGQKPWGPLEEHVKRDGFGMKSGKGFYDWPGDSAEKLHRKLNMELIRLLKQDMENGSI
jgi:3-hydroxybutyryl-CoA dehydrogenase